MLYKIPLIGANTGNVEAFPGYLQRVANIHGISTRKLFQVLGDINVAKKISPYSVKIDHFSLDGLLVDNVCVSIYLSILESEIGISLKSSTFEVLKHFLDVGKTISRTRRWCPECFADSLDADADPYIKLLWYFKEVTHCPLHLTPLISRCARCNSAQGNRCTKAAPYICGSCNQLLSDRGLIDTSTYAPSWRVSGTDLVRFLAQLNQCDLDESIFKFGLKKSICDFSYYCTDIQFEQAYRYCWSHRAVREMIWGYTPITLKAVRKISYLCGVDIFDFVSGNIKNVSKYFDWEKKLPHPYASPPKDVALKHLNNRGKIHELIMGNSGLSMDEVARLTDLSKEYMEYFFPDITAKIEYDFSRKSAFDVSQRRK